MEAHHYIIERALANAVDSAKFNAILLPDLKHRYTKKAGYPKEAFTAEDVAKWDDHSEDNLWVLGDLRHRTQYVGIHEITDPIRRPMDLLRDDFGVYVRGKAGSTRQFNEVSGSCEEKSIQIGREMAIQGRACRRIPKGYLS